MLCVSFVKLSPSILNWIISIFCADFLHFFSSRRVRKATWERLQMFSGGTLTELIDQLTKRDLLYPLLTNEHYKAIERRLLMIYAAVEICIDRHGKDAVLK